MLLTPPRLTSPGRRGHAGTCIVVLRMSRGMSIDADTKPPVAVTEGSVAGSEARAALFGGAKATLRDVTPAAACR